MKNANVLLCLVLTAFVPSAFAANTVCDLWTSSHPNDHRGVSYVRNENPEQPLSQTYNFALKDGGGVKIEFYAGEGSNYFEIYQKSRFLPGQNKVAEVDLDDDRGSSMTKTLSLGNDTLNISCKGADAPLQSAPVSDQFNTMYCGVSERTSFSPGRLKIALGLDGGFGETSDYKIQFQGNKGVGYFLLDNGKQVEVDASRDGANKISLAIYDMHVNQGIKDKISEATFIIGKNGEYGDSRVAIGKGNDAIAVSCGLFNPEDTKQPLASAQAGSPTVFRTPMPAAAVAPQDGFVTQ